MPENSSVTNANKQNLPTRQLIIHHAIAFLVGASLFSLLSLGQKIMIGMSPFVLKGYLVPVLAGGSAGLLVSVWRRKSQQVYTQLQKNKSICRTLIEQATDSIFIMDGQEHFVEVNSYACNMLGYSREELLQLTMHDLTLPAQHATIPQHLDDIPTEEQGIKRLQIRRKDNSVLPAEMNRVRLQNDHFLVIVHDISTRDKAEMALRESEEKYRRLTETAQDIILTHDFDDRITYANKAAINIIGYSESEILQLTLQDILPEEQMLEAKARQKQRVSGQSNVFHYETAIITAQGQIVPLEISSVTLMKHGKPFGILIIGRDITERKKTEAALRETHQLLETIFDQTHLMFAYLDPQFNFIKVNRAFAQADKREPSFFPGKNHFELYPYAKNETIFRQVVETGETHFEYAKPFEYFTHPERGVSYWDWSLLPVKDDQGAVVGLILSILNVTEQVQAKQALWQTQKTESLGILAGGIAHDFNNLLVAMLGQMSLAQAKLSDENPVRPHIEKAAKAAERAADLTRQMLAYSGRGQFEVRPVNLNNLITENLHLFQTSIPKNVELRSKLADSLPLIEADTGQMQQVIMNLILNGAQAIENKQGYVMVTTGTQMLDEEDGRYTQHTGRKLSAGQYVTLEIHENGRGIPPDILPKIFDPFFSTKEKGHGLGLAAVLGIVRGHNGGLYVYSEVNKGTTFKVLFPASQHTADEPAGPRPAIRELALKKCVLVIDDETAVCEAVTDILELHAIEVITAPDGASGIALYRERLNDVDLVLLDLSMPGMDGSETFRELRRINPDVRVILSSGYNQVEATQHFIGKGLAAFIQKPYKASDLIEAVKQHM